MKAIRTLKIILLIELAITIPYAWGILGFQPTTETKCTAVGTFSEPFEASDVNGNIGIHYQFKSNDNEVWWMLTAEEIGFVPNVNTEYILTYDNNGTTKGDKPCDCCECEVYDDVFISVERR